MKCSRCKGTGIHIDHNGARWTCSRCNGRGVIGTVEKREPVPAKDEPTHVLRVEVPLRIDEGKTLYFDPIKDALDQVLAISRLASAGLVCGNTQVSVDEPGRKAA